MLSLAMAHHHPLSQSVLFSALWWILSFFTLCIFSRFFPQRSESLGVSGNPVKIPVTLSRIAWIKEWAKWQRKVLYRARGNRAKTWGLISDLLGLADSDYQILALHFCCLLFWRGMRIIAIRRRKAIEVILERNVAWVKQAEIQELDLRERKWRWRALKYSLNAASRVVTVSEPRNAGLEREMGDRLPHTPMMVTLVSLHILSPQCLICKSRRGCLNELTKVPSSSNSPWASRLTCLFFPIPCILYWHMNVQALSRTCSEAFITHPLSYLVLLHRLISSATLLSLQSVSMFS